MDVCDPALASHAARVGANAEAVARRLGWSDDRLEALRLGAALHDVGKVNVRPEVLGKAGLLDERELAEIRAHPVEGTWLIAGVPSLSPALPYVLFHHEWWNGSGYPLGLHGRAIPAEARLLAIADAFDAMTSARPYRHALTHDRALQEVDACAGTQFDPNIAALFCETWASQPIVLSA